MAEINVGNRMVQVPDDLDPKKASTRAPQLRGNAFGDAAARAANPRVVTPPMGAPIAEHPGMTGANPNRDFARSGAPGNNDLLRAAQQRVDPVQTAARNAAYAPQASPLKSAWSPYESEVRAQGNPRVGPAAAPERGGAPKVVQGDPTRFKSLQVGQTGTAPAAVPEAPATQFRGGAAQGGSGSKWFGSAGDWNKTLPSGGDSPHSSGKLTAFEAPGKFAKGIGVVQGAVGAYDTVQGLREGDYDRAAVGGADALAAGALFSPAAPAAAAYLGARGAWDTGQAVGGMVNERLSDKTKNTIGGVVNTAMNYFGGGYDEGKKADNDIKLAQQFNTSVAAQQPGGMPAVTAHSSGPARETQTDLQRGGNSGPSLPTQILRQGNSYSGPANISGDVQINGKGGGTVTMMGGNAGDLTSAQRMAMDQRAHDIQMQSAGLRQQIQDNGFPTPGAAIMSGETLGSALRAKSDAQGSLSTLDRRDMSGRQRAADDRAKERNAAEERRALMGDETQRRGQDITGQGQRLLQQTALRGQDMDYGGKMMQNQTAAARLRYDQGKDARDFVQKKIMDDSQLSTAEQTRGNHATSNADTRSEGAAVVRDKDGQLVVSKGQQAINRDLRNSVAPGYDLMDEKGQAQHKPVVDAATNLVGGMNALSRTSLAQVLRLDGPTPARTTLPDLQDARAEYLDAGDIESWIPGNGLSRGDVRVQLRDGSTTYVPRDKYNANEMTLLGKYSRK